MTVQDSSVIETARLRLRPTVPADRDTVIELQTDPEIRTYLPPPISHERAAQWFDQHLLHPRSFGRRRQYDLAIADRETDQRLGTIQLEPRSSGRPGHVLPEGYELELTRILNRRAIGHGYGLEAAQGLLGHLAAQLPDQPILAMNNVANRRALRSTARLGFRPNRVFVEFGAEQQLMVAQLATFAPQPSPAVAPRG